MMISVVVWLALTQCRGLINPYANKHDTVPTSAKKASFRVNVFPVGGSYVTAFTTTKDTVVTRVVIAPTPTFAARS